MSCPIDGLLDIRIVKYDVRAFATKLERDVLQIALRGGLHDLTTDQSATSEGNFVNLHMARDCRSNSVAISGEKVERPGWKSGFVNKLTHANCSQRSKF